MNSSAIDSQGISTVPQSADSQSFKTKARFVGRGIKTTIEKFGADFCSIMVLPFGSIGGGLGGISGLVGGLLYEAAKYAMGQEAQLKKLEDYVTNSANLVGRGFMLPPSLIAVPISVTVALTVGACGVAGAFAGALVTPVVAPIYKMVKACQGESLQDKKLSDYIIKSAELGAKGFMCLSVVGLASAVIYCCPPAVISPLLLWHIAGCVLLGLNKASDVQTSEGHDGP